MKLNKKIALAALGVVLGATALVGANEFYSKKSVSELTLNNIDASADFFEWWNSPTYDCVPVKCLLLSNYLLGQSIYGTQEGCLDGDENAHCWNCQSFCTNK